MCHQSVCSFAGRVVSCPRSSRYFVVILALRWLLERLDFYDDHLHGILTCMNVTTELYIFKIQD